MLHVNYTQENQQYKYNLEQVETALIGNTWKLACLSLYYNVDSLKVVGKLLTAGQKKNKTLWRLGHYPHIYDKFYIFIAIFSYRSLLTRKSLFSVDFPILV